jgi:hypothetical protein
MKIKSAIRGMEDVFEWKYYTVGYQPAADKYKKRSAGKLSPTG